VSTQIILCNYNVCEKKVRGEVENLFYFMTGIVRSNTSHFSLKQSGKKYIVQTTVVIVSKTFLLYNVMVIWCTYFATWMTPSSSGHMDPTSWRTSWTTWTVSTSSDCSHLLTLVPYLRIFVPWRWRRYVPPKCRFTQNLHGDTSQKTAFFIVTTVKTSNLTCI
jgi:hypothetical protein